MKNLNQPTKRSGVGTATVFAAAALLLRLIRCTRLCGLFYILNMCAAACAVTFAVGRRVAEGVHCATFGDRLFAGGAIRIAGVACCGAACRFLVDRYQRVRLFGNGCAFGDRLLADGADLIARVALGGASGGFGVLRGCLMRCKRLLRVAADILLAVVAIDSCGVALDRAGGGCRSDGFGVDVVAGVYRNGFGFGGVANRAGVSFCACCRAGGGFRHGAAVPTVVRFFNVAAVTGANALMLGVVQLCPRAVAVTERGNVLLCLGRVTDCAGVGFCACCRAGGGFGDGAAVPSVVRFFDMTAVTGADALMLGIVELCPRAVAVTERGNVLCLGRVTDCAGVGLCAGCTTRCSFGHSAAVPRMVCFFNVAAVTGTHTLVLRVVELRPCAVAVASCRNSFCFGRLTNRAGICFHAGSCARRGFGHGAGVPRMVCFFNVAAITGTHTLMLGIVELRPCAVAVTEFRDCLCIGCTAGTGISAHAVGGAGCSFGNS